MHPSSLVVVFVCKWWIIFFMTLPFGVTLDENGPEISGPGAPERPNLKRKIVIATLISILICGMIFWTVDADFFSFREVAKSMAQEDYQ